MATGALKNGGAPAIGEIGGGLVDLVVLALWALQYPAKR
jgi:hypothetical protein